MDRRFRLAVLVGMALITLAVGVMSYNAGMSHGLAIAAPEGATTAVRVVPYGWYRPWGFGFLGPFMLVFFWFVVLRMFWWGGYHRRRWYYPGPYDGPSAFDEWHRRAHERMGGEAEKS
jgi:hypothetical protein